jgi:hypothetical protein
MDRALLKAHGQPDEDGYVASYCTFLRRRRHFVLAFWGLLCVLGVMFAPKFLLSTSPTFSPPSTSQAAIGDAKFASYFGSLAKTGANVLVIESTDGSQLSYPRANMTAAEVETLCATEAGKKLACCIIKEFATGLEHTIMTDPAAEKFRNGFIVDGGFQSYYTYWAQASRRRTAAAAHHTRNMQRSHPHHTTLTDRPALPCPALPCPALPCPARPCRRPARNHQTTEQNYSLISGGFVAANDTSVTILNVLVSIEDKYALLKKDFVKVRYGRGTS